MHPDDGSLGRKLMTLTTPARAGFVGGVVLAGLLYVGSAAASPPPPPPAVQQYIETLPTGGGSHPLTSGSNKSHLSSSLARKIDAQGGVYTPMLKAIVNSNNGKEPTRSLDGRLSPSAAPGGDVVTAALDSGSTGDTLFVVIVALAVAFASATAAVRWRASRRARTS
jgi:hypothetical protein